MRRYGASPMQPPPDPTGDEGVRAACLTGVVSAALTSPFSVSVSLMALKPHQGGSSATLREGCVDSGDDELVDVMVPLLRC
jgi:hypothetical protein